MRSHTHLLFISFLYAIFLIGCSGNQWIKDERSGCAVYNHNPIDNEYILYEGDCREGIADGIGRVIWYRDSVPTALYAGRFNAGILDGEAMVHYFRPPLDSFQGTFKNGNKEGPGTYYFSFGKQIRSVFTNGKPSDSTLIIWRNGKKYIGMIDEYLGINGNGRIYFPNNDYFEGEFVKSKRHGTGVYVWANGDRFEGEYENDKRTPRGVYHYADGTQRSVWSLPQDQRNTLQKEQPSVDFRGMLNAETVKAIHDRIFSTVEYPATLRRSGIEFNIDFELFVDTNGTIIKYLISKTPAAAQETVDDIMTRILNTRYPVSSEEGEIFQYWISLPYKFRMRSR